MESGGQASTHCDSNNLVHAMTYQLMECPDEEVDRQNAVKEWDGNVNLNWRDEFQVANDYVSYRNKFVEMLTQFQNMCDGPLGSIKAVELRIELGKSKDRPIHSAAFRPVWGRESSRNGKREDACHGFYRSRLDRMGIIYRVRVKRGWQTLLQRLIPKTKRRNDTGLVTDTGHG